MAATRSWTIQLVTFAAVESRWLMPDQMPATAARLLVDEEQCVSVGVAAERGRLRCIGRDGRLPMEDVVWSRVGRVGPAVARREVFEQLDPRAAAGGGQRGDAEVCVVHVVQVRLLGAVVLAI